MNIADQIEILRERGMARLKSATRFLNSYEFDQALGEIDLARQDVSNIVTMTNLNRAPQSVWTVEKTNKI